MAKKEMHIKEYPFEGSRSVGILFESNHYKIISEKDNWEQIQVFSENDIHLSGWIAKEDFYEIPEDINKKELIISPWLVPIIIIILLFIFLMFYLFVNYEFI